MIMKIEFEQKLSEKEWFDFNKIYLHFKNKKLRLFLIVMIVFSAILLLLSLFLIWSFFRTPSFVFVPLTISNIIQYYPLGFFITFLSFLLVISFTLRYRFQIDIALKKMLKDPRNKDLFPQQSFYLDNEHVLVSTDLSSSTMQWKAFTEVVETKDHIAFFKNSSNMVLLRKKELMQYQIRQIDTVIKNDLSDVYLSLQ